MWDIDDGGFLESLLLHTSSSLFLSLFLSSVFFLRIVECMHVDEANVQTDSLGERN